MENGILETNKIGQAVIKTRLDYIQKVLDKNKVNVVVRGILETQKIGFEILGVLVSDQPKVETMWRTYKTGYKLLWVLIPLIMADVVLRFLDFFRSLPAIAGL